MTVALFVFIFSTQLVIYGFAWLVTNLMFKGSNVFAIVMLCAGVVMGFLSMYELGWIF